MKLFELFMLALLYAFIVMTLGSIILHAVVFNAIDRWFKREEEYAKRMALMPGSKNEYETTNVN